MSAARCRRPACGGPLHIDTDGQGRVLSVCAWCVRKRRRICRECPMRTPNGRAVRCVGCARARHLSLARERDRERYPKRRKYVLERHRQAPPAVREHKRRYIAAYRASHPRDGLDRAYQRAYMAARRADPTYRAKQNARKRALRLQRRAQERAA